MQIISKTRTIVDQSGEIYARVIIDEESGLPDVILCTWREWFETCRYVSQIGNFHTTFTAFDVNLGIFQSIYGILAEDVQCTCESSERVPKSERERDREIEEGRERGRPERS